MKTILMILFGVLTTSCSMTIPLHWETPRSAFSGGEANESSSPGAMASRQSVFNFPYAEVITSAEKALSFAQINVMENDKSSGTIYGTRASAVSGQTLKRYYLVKIKEDGPEKCTLSVFSKEQQSGTYWKWGTTVVIPSVALGALMVTSGGGMDYPATAIGGALVYPVIAVPLVYFLNSDAKKKAGLKWSINDDEYLDRIMSFIRTDLLQQ